MSNPKTDGPRSPRTQSARPPQVVGRLVPFVHVQVVERSIAFYSHLGFAVTSVYTYQDQPVWAALASDAAELMVTTDGETIDPERQGILFYLYCQDLLALRTQLLAAGLDPGAIVDGTPGPTQELRLVDPDGYVLMIAQND